MKYSTGGSLVAARYRIGEIRRVSDIRTEILLVLAGLLTVRAGAQSVLFDFDNAPLYTPLPIDLTVGGITAHLSATGQGYSIQGTTTVPVVPVGFSGHYIYIGKEA